MKKCLVFFVCVALLTVPTIAQTAWKPTKAAVTFSIKEAGLGVEGSFDGFAGTLLFDPAKPETGKLLATVETATLDTGIGARDSHLRKRAYFDIARHPRISLTSVGLEKKDGNAYAGVFDLTLKGTTRRVNVPFTFTQTGNTAQFTGSFRINRLDYKVGKSNFFLSDNVTITLSVAVKEQTVAAK